MQQFKNPAALAEGRHNRGYWRIHLECTPIVLPPPPLFRAQRMFGYIVTTRELALKSREPKIARIVNNMAASSWAGNQGGNQQQKNTKHNSHTAAGGANPV